MRRDNRREGRRAWVSSCLLTRTSRHVAMRGCVVTERRGSAGTGSGERARSRKGLGRGVRLMFAGGGRQGGRWVRWVEGWLI